MTSDPGRAEGLRPVRAVAPRPVDLRLVPSAAAAWLAALVVTRVPPRAAALGAVLALVTAALALVRHRGRPSACRRGARAPAAALALAVVVAAATLLAGAEQRAARESGLLPQAAREQATVLLVGTVTGDARPEAPAWPGAPVRVTIVLAAGSVTSHGRTGPALGDVLVVGPPAWSAAPYRAKVSVTGRAEPSRSGERTVALLVTAAAPRVVAPPPAWARATSAVRDRVLRLAGRQPAEAGALLAGITVGDTSRLPDGLTQDLRTVGLTHVTAVSGAHFSLVVALVLALAAACRAPRPVQGLCAVLATGATVALVHPDPSVVRAAAMGLVGVLGLLVGRAARAPAALAASVVVLLTTDPWLAAELGFVLSVLATAGLVLLGGPMTHRWAGAIGHAGAQATALPVAAQLVCAPVLLLVAPGIATYAVPANVLAAPAVGPATVLGLLAGLVDPVAPGVARALAACAGAACWWVAAVAHATARLPGARVGWAPGLGGVLVLTLATVCLCVLLLRERGPAPPPAPDRTSA